MYRLRNGVLSNLATSQQVYNSAAYPVSIIGTNIEFPSNSFDIAVAETALPGDQYIMTVSFNTTGELKDNAGNNLLVNLYTFPAPTSSFFNSVSNDSLSIFTNNVE